MSMQAEAGSRVLRTLDRRRRVSGPAAAWPCASSELPEGVEVVGGVPRRPDRPWLAVAEHPARPGVPGHRGCPA
ncbi:MAG: hypothetical protein U5R48_18045 [Gammaproteobacteria bacterium]|nr:hypothetical protein [Gammaproteobacteria bacterium]